MIRFIPSNGTEGMQFIDEFCSNCVHEKFMNTQVDGDKQCEIFNNSILNNRPCFDKDLDHDGWEWFCNKEFTEWKCNQYQHWDWGDDDFNEPPRPSPYDPNQLLLFTFDEKIDELINIKEEELV